jgi:hypothetical protein
LLRNKLVSLIGFCMNNKLALYIAYYLARFNEEALRNLGYYTWREAFDDIGQKLQVKTRSIKNWRDEFDPLFVHRAGWHRRPMHPSRVRIAQALEALDEHQIREIVLDILSGKNSQDNGDFEQLLLVASSNDTKTKKDFIVRGPTGRRAEELFIESHAAGVTPYSGNLIDCRDLGCGYDFKIVTNAGEIFIEVKGMAEASGGILFTDKEWRTAKEHRARYILCVVKNIPENPSISYVHDPASVCNVKKNIYTSIQINYSLSDKELSKLIR